MPVYTFSVTFSHDDIREVEVCPVFVGIDSETQSSYFVQGHNLNPDPSDLITDDDDKDNGNNSDNNDNVTCIE